MTHSHFSSRLLLASIFLLMTSLACFAKQPNVLIMTVDDMSCDSVGAYGCSLPDTTPNMDALAETSLRFEHAHVQVGNCMPSRNVMWSGRFPHNNRVEGFYPVPDPDYPVLCDLARQAGYFTAIRHKVSHSTPYHPYAWDLNLETAADGSKRHVKHAASYGDSARQAIAAAEKAGKPFCLMINVSDPHKPFYTQGYKDGKDPHVPSLVFSGEQVPVPGFLPDDREVRDELALYYSSVRRADDCIGEVMKVLAESGHEKDTFVMFLSDHGMPLPFAKTQLYHHSTRTPLMVRWPEVTKPGSVDSEHMVSAVDFIPTLSEVMGFEAPEKLDGQSFASILRGESQNERTFVIKEYNENSGSKRNPMRGIETKEYLYLFNPWSNGKLVMATATNGTKTWKRMKSLASGDAAIATRVAVMEHRSVEELYDIASDPDCLVNLIDSPKHQKAAEELRVQLLQEMQRTGDPLAAILPQRDDPLALQQFMDEAQAEADERKRRRKAKSQPKPKSMPVKPAGKNFFQWFGKVEGKKLIVTVNYKLPSEFQAATIPLIVTLKSAKNQRLERQQADIRGNDQKVMEFTLPAGVDIKTLKMAAYIGPDYQHNWQYESATVGKLTK